MTAHPDSPELIAERAALHAFVNAYLREVDAGTWYEPPAFASAHGHVFDESERYVVLLDLESSAQTIALGVRCRSQVGRHSFTAVRRRQRGGHEWTPVDGLSVALALVEDIYAASPRSAARVEMLVRLLESHQNMARYVASHLQRGGEIPAGFIASEGAAVLGHWLHPSPKSRQGFLGYHHQHYAPECSGRFQLYFFAADRSLCDHLSMTGQSADELARGLAGRGGDVRAYERRVLALGDDFCLLPVHPLQAQWLLHQDYVRALLARGHLVELGPLGPTFRATSSVRTIYCETEPYMLKVSLPVKITNSLRINLKSELGDGVWLSVLFQRYHLAAEFPRLRIIDDPAYIALALPEREETGFEVVFRTNPFRADLAAPAGPEVHSILTLTQEPLRRGDTSLLETIVRRHALATGLELEDAATRIFDAYFSSAVEPVILLFDRYGIALEAHQQNVLVEFDQTGLPLVAHYRDTQGIGLAASTRARHLAEVPQLAEQTKLFEPDDVVRDGLGYYLIHNQLFAMVHRLAADGLLEESALLERSRRRLRDLRGSMRQLGRALLDSLLDHATQAFKGNLLTRVADVDELETENELGVYIRVPNPLTVPEPLEPQARALPDGISPRRRPRAAILRSGEAEVGNGRRYIEQLCKHWARKLQVRLDDDRATVVFPKEPDDPDYPEDARATFRATKERIYVELTAFTEVQLDVLSGVIEDHLARFAFREDGLRIAWRPATSRPVRKPRSAAQHL